MTPRRRRLILVIGILVGVSVSGALALTAFRQNVTFYFVPSQVAAGQVHGDQHFRLGGMVERGSVQRSPGSLKVRFEVTDFKHRIPVVYDKVLPDLFREGQGVIAHGHLDADGVFVADEVLAKHDEKYMPPGMAAQIKAEHGGVMPYGASGLDTARARSGAPSPAAPPQSAAPITSAAGGPPPGGS